MAESDGEVDSPEDAAPKRWKRQPASRAVGARGKRAKRQTRAAQQAAAAEDDDDALQESAPEKHRSKRAVKVSFEDENADTEEAADGTMLFSVASRAKDLRQDRQDREDAEAGERDEDQPEEEEEEEDLLAQYKATQDESDKDDFGDVDDDEEADDFLYED